jgi:hypothetical protein
MMNPDKLRKMGIEILQESPGNRIMRVRISDLSIVLFIAIAIIAFVLFAIISGQSRIFTVLGLKGKIIYYGAFLIIAFLSCLPLLNYIFNPCHIEIESDCIDIHLRGFMFIAPRYRKTEYLSEIVSVSTTPRFLGDVERVGFRCKDGSIFRLPSIMERGSKLLTLANILNRWIEEEKAAQSTDMQVQSGTCSTNS